MRAAMASRAWQAGASWRSVGAAVGVLAFAGLAHAETTAPVETTVAALATEAAPAPLPESPHPTIVARIDVSDQKMFVYVDERLTYTFPVSTARRGYITPVGQYKAEWLSRYHRSRKYDNAPMPWAVFFHDGWAIHGTTDLRHLGKPASHGCVRLHPKNAQAFFTLVKQAGMENTLIAVVK